MMRSAQSGNDKAELIRGGSRGERLPLPEKTLLTVQQRCSHNMMLYPTLHMGGGNFGRVGGVGGNTSTVGDHHQGPSMGAMGGCSEIWELYHSWLVH